MIQLVIEIPQKLYTEIKDSWSIELGTKEIAKLKKSIANGKPLPKGKWIADVDKWGDIVTTVNGYRCDKCNTFNADKDNYCPHCGAYMREGE